MQPTGQRALLHADLGNITGSFVVPIAIPTTLVYSRSVTYDMGRVGVSYKFAGPY